MADIGSTLTKLSAFAALEQAPRFLGQSTAPTTVAEGDVTLGLEAARQALERQSGVDTSGAALFATSSAAGGLRMTVHGLTQDMTLRAARDASLGAGAIVVLSTAGLLSAPDLADIRRCQPTLILLAGGVDYGDQQVVLANARALATLGEVIPVIYAGNKAVRREVAGLLQAAGMPVFLVENVYPRLDVLDLAPVRRVIQDVFARHIVTAPGLDKLKALLRGPVMPTPGAVMQATELLAELWGDVLTVDVGGATTDVHSVTDGSPAYARLLVAPEPRSKRTVEGDLGVYRNAAHIVAAAGAALGDVEMCQVVPLPETDAARQSARRLTRWAVDLAIWRHAGDRRTAYGVSGRYDLIEGRDLTAIRYIIGTGGALTRLGMGHEILGSIKPDPSRRKLLPPSDARVLLDQHYIMAAAGVLRQAYPQAARTLLLSSLGVQDVTHG